jgi:lipopolysaccharide export system permease protein
MLLDRYLLRQLSGPFVFSLLTLGCLMTTGFVLFTLMEEAVRFQIPVDLFLKILLLRVPEMLFFTLPMSVLFATLLTFGRLVLEQELLALRLLGWSLWRVLVPVLSSAVAVAGLTLVFNETLIPPAVWQARELRHYAMTRQRSLPLEQHHLLYREYAQGKLLRLVYAERAQGSQLEQVWVQQFLQGELSLVLRARQARWEGNVWHFEQGDLLRFEAFPSRHPTVATFASYRLPIAPTLGEWARESRQPTEMNLRELGRHIAVMKLAGQEPWALQVRWHQKLAIPASAVVFAALALGLTGQSLRSRAQGFGLSLLIIFGFYLFLAMGTALGDAGKIPAGLAAWLPHGVGGTLALILIHRRNFPVP